MPTAHLGIGSVYCEQPWVSSLVCSCLCALNHPLAPVYHDHLVAWRCSWFAPPPAALNAAVYAPFQARRGFTLALRANFEHEPCCIGNGRGNPLINLSYPYLTCDFTLPAIPRPGLVGTVNPRVQAKVYAKLASVLGGVGVRLRVALTSTLQTRRCPTREDAHHP